MKNDLINPGSNARFFLRAIGWTGALMLLVGLVVIRFDVVIESRGIVEAKNSQRIYAPREAFVEEIFVSAGETVALNQPLLRLRNESLQREIHEVREGLESARAEARLAENRLRETEMTGGSVEARAAEISLSLHREKENLLKEIVGMYQRLKETGAVSMLELLNLSSQQLAARREALRDETLLTLKAEGYVTLLVERQTLLRDAALSRVALLQERLDTLRTEEERLLVKAPGAGTVANLFVRDTGLRVAGGELLLSLADTAAGYEVRMFVPDRNVDLIRPGLPVRLESMVFASSAEGYMHGSVLSVITDERSRDAGGFEVRVSVDRWPVEPVIGSQVRAEILLQRQGLKNMLGRNELRHSQRNPEDPDGP